MNRQLYLECHSGISGDMTVASLLDLGANEEVLRASLASLSIKDAFSIKISRVKKSGLDACDFDVILMEGENLDHDMEYLHGEGHNHEHNHHDAEHSHSHEHHHDEEHNHSHEHHHAHEHRSYQDIIEIITSSQITPGAKKLALRVFDILADSESKAHNVPKKEVHFHEVGAVDSIVDIVAFAVCMDDLGIDEVVVPGISEGTGSIRCQHGIIPVPVPAVVNIASAHHLTLRNTGIQGELVTPTGAAMAASVITSRKLPEAYTICKTGMGAGKREYERPSILRAFIIEADQDLVSDEKTITDNYQKPDEVGRLMADGHGDSIYKLETNIDDCTGETLGYVMEFLLEAGARDVHYTPVFMKKNRPAYQLNVICGPDDIGRMEEIIFRETTTIGIRRFEMERTVLSRQKMTASTEYGSIEIKVCKYNGAVYYYPEYDSVKAACKRAEQMGQAISFQEMYLRAQQEGMTIE